MEAYMVIQHNMSAKNSERMQKIISGKMAGTSEKLSSGYRINRAADDAARLSISEKMRFQARGLDRGSVNIDEGIGYCQVADGALQEMQDMLQRMNELSIEAANGTLSETDRKYIDDEVSNLKEEIDRICVTTRYNEEYIFRCEDKTALDSPQQVYKLSFQGYPDDLCIYNESYDDATHKAVYGGVAFRGKRYAWNSIDPNMYNATTGKFRGGQYVLHADDGTEVTLICKEGSEPPQGSREYVTSSSEKGIYVNGELIPWDQVRTASNKKFDQNMIIDEDYYFDYHGVTISFKTSEKDDFSAVLSKISGTVWNSTYRIPTEQTALVAEFANTTMPVTDKDQILQYLQSGSTEKYTLRAGDGKNGSFDGIWLADVMVQHSNNNILNQSASSLLAQANQMNRAVLALLQ